MLVVGLVVQIAAVLLDGVDAELGGIDRLHAEVVILETAIDLTVAVAAGAAYPQVLQVLALNDMIPVVATTVGLRLAEPGGVVEGALGDEQLDLIPQGLGLSVQAL